MKKKGLKNILKNKRALSTIIVTLILILISLVAIGVFWVVIQNLIQGNTENIGLEKLTLSTEIKGVNIDNSSNNVTLAVKRNVGEGEIVGMKFVFYNGSSTEIISEDFELEELVERKFVLHLAMNVTSLTKISIVPLFRSTDGKENIGNVADSFDVRTGKRIETIPNPPSGNQTCTPAVNPCAGRVCGTVQNGTCGNINCGSYGGGCQSGYNCVSGTCVIQTGIICEATNGARCWYVDNLATGTNNGSNWANAWQSLSTINWASIQPGDFIYISGGTTSKTYSESITISIDGNSSSSITIRPGLDSGHNGIVVFDYNSYGDSGTVSAITISNRNYLTFNGTVNGEKHLQIKNLRNILDRSAAYGIYGYSTRKIIIDGLTFRNMNNPIRLFYSTNISVGNSDFLETRGNAGIDIFGASGTWDSNKIYNNYIEALFNDNEPPGATTSYSGPDSIECGNATSIYNNIFKANRTTVYTSDQHPDTVQSTGVKVKIYNNLFINVGDSNLDLAGDYYNPRFEDVWVYNNIFTIIETIDSYPEFIRIYGTSGYGIQSITNYKIFNNLFIDDTIWSGIKFMQYQGTGNPSASGNEIKNNIFYNVGTGDQWHPVILIENSSNFNSTSFSFDRNVYYHPSNTPHIVYRGVDYSISSWMSTYEPGARTTAPLFTSYSPFNVNNNYHLISTDSSARDAGLSFASYFTTDKEGISRPQGSAWDIGPYEYN